jgi:hypothetical protein
MWRQAPKKVSLILGSGACLSDDESTRDSPRRPSLRGMKKARLRRALLWVNPDGSADGFETHALRACAFITQAFFLVSFVFLVVAVIEEPL